jgi:hypothetical protein
MPDENIRPNPRPRSDRVRREEDEDDRPRRRRRDEEDEDDDDLQRIRRNDPIETFIPYRNPQGLIAYYLGVFSLIPCVALLLGPAAIVLGILGLKYRKKHPSTGGGGHAIAGIVLGSLTTFAHVVGIVVFIVVVASR